MTDDRTMTAPYISFRTLSNMLDRLQSGGIPQHIDRHYWGAFLNGSVGQQLMLALKFLGLVTLENEPTPMLERLVDPETRKGSLKDLLRERYSGIWDAGIDPARTTPGHLESAIGRVYNVDGETRRKALTFFVHAARYAELPLSKQVTERARQTKPNPATTAKAKPRPQRQTQDSILSRSGMEPTLTSRPERAQDAGSLGPYEILRLMLTQLPADQRWSSDMRDRWIRALTANLDFMVTVQDEAGVDDDYVFEDDEAEFGDE